MSVLYYVGLHIHCSIALYLQGIQRLYPNVVDKITVCELVHTHSLLHPQANTVCYTHVCTNG